MVGNPPRVWEKLSAEAELCLFKGAWSFSSASILLESQAEQEMRLEGLTRDLAHPRLFTQRLQDTEGSKRQPTKQVP